MPFIVEARRENLPDVVSGERDAVIVSRLAVGTLEEARAHAKGLVTLNRSAFYSAAFDLAMAQIDALSESGGTITLPDGQVVEVEPVTPYELWKQGGGQPTTWATARRWLLPPIWSKPSTRSSPPAPPQPVKEPEMASQKGRDMRPPASDVRPRTGFVLAYRCARPGLFIAASFFSAATHSPWAFAAAFGFGLAGCLDALR